MLETESEVRLGYTKGNKKNKQADNRRILSAMQLDFINTKLFTAS